MRSQLFSQFNSTIGVLDKNGIILYASPPSFIGKHVFGAEVQSAFPSMLSSQDKASLDNLLRDSLNGNVGSGDIISQGKMNTLAYEPVKVNGKYFLTLFISAPHNLASNVNALIEQQKNFSIFIVIVIGIIAFGIAFLVLLWNRRLENTVNTRTLELKRANEQLKIHDKMQKEFINVASHEIKTPTHAILGYAELLQSRPDKREQISDALYRNAKKLQRLTNDILDVTRIESQTLKINKEKFNLNDLIACITEDFENDIAKKGGDIRILYKDSSQSTVEVEADKERISQVISNLLSNAIKFTEEGSISIEVTKKRENEHAKNNSHEEEAVVSVVDTGTGIDYEILPRLFTKFATKSDTGGTGLGLFISKSIVEAHGGKMWAENNNKIDNGQKRGATFYFSLPLMTNNNKIQSDSKENVNEISGQSYKR